MTKYRVCGGLAITPNRDMKLLGDMSKKGWHLSKLRGILYSFDKGEPHDYIYSLNLEKNTTQEMLSIYEASGWTPVVVEKGYQIFRAEADTTPIFSDVESEMEVLHKNRRWSGKWSLLFAALIAICFILNTLIESILFIILGLLLYMLFVFTFFPFIGYTVTLHKLKQK